jgi:hypothetical protein
MYYTAENIEQRDTFIVGDDIELDFILRDQNGTVISTFTSIKITINIESYGGSEVTLKNTAAGGGDTQISISGSVISMHLLGTDTDDFSVGKYRITMVVESSSKEYTAFDEYVQFNEDWLDR